MAFLPFQDNQQLEKSRNKGAAKLLVLGFFYAASG
jgi:hypothetical protein